MLKNLILQNNVLLDYQEGTCICCVSSQNKQNILFTGRANFNKHGFSLKLQRERVFELVSKISQKLAANLMVQALRTSSQVTSGKVFRSLGKYTRNKSSR